MSDEARAFYSAHAQRQTPPNLKELLQVLRTEAGRISTFFIVLDAFDEFSDTKNARATILLELHQIPNARVMITGRSHVGNTVRSKLDEVSTLMIRASNDDIRKYLDTRIEKSLYLYEMMKGDQGFRATVINGIVGKADGMLISPQRSNSDNVRFLVTALHVDFLEDQPNEHHIRCALDRLPKGLDETYDAAVKRIRTQPNPENVKLAIRTLKWVTFAREHLQEKASCMPWQLKTKTRISKKVIYRTLGRCSRFAYCWLPWIKKAVRSVLSMKQHDNTFKSISRTCKKRMETLRS